MNVDVMLAQLETAQLVRRYPEEEYAYIFKHALTQDATYQSLLVKQRRAIHAHVVQVYEDLYPDRLDEFAAMIARHAMEAGDDAKALAYAARAGDVAARTNANTEAIWHYARALEIAKRAEPKSTLSLLKDLYLKRGRMFELNSQFDQALANYDEMEIRAQEDSDGAMQLGALIARATIYSIPSSRFDLERAKSLCEQALTLARNLGDQPAQAQVLWNMMLLNTRLESNYLEAIGYGEQAIEIARTLNLREQLAYLLNDISMPYVFEGEPELGAQANLQSRELWRAMNNLPMLTDNLSYAAMRHISLGEYTQAVATSREALEISQRIGNVWGQAFSQSWVGEALVELGHIADAITGMENAVRLGESSFRATLSFTRADLAGLYGDLGQVARGIELAQLADIEGEKLARTMNIFTSAQLAHLHLLNGDPVSAETVLDNIQLKMSAFDQSSFYGTALTLTRAELAFAQQDDARTIQICDQLIDYLKSHHLRERLVDALYLKGMALRRQGNLEQASICLEEGRAEGEKSNSRWMLWRILSALAEIEMQRGNHDQAQTLRAQAREIVDYIVAHTPEELRTSFLNLPAVREVMS